MGFELSMTEIGLSLSSPFRLYINIKMTAKKIKNEVEKTQPHSVRSESVLSVVHIGEQKCTYKNVRRVK